MRPGLGLCLATLLLFAANLFAHGGGHREPPPEPPAPPPTPTPRIPPPPPTPPSHPVPTPTTPSDTPVPTPPTTPPPAKTGRPTTRRSIKASGSHWRLWWIYNREYLLDLRQRIRRAGAGTVTGPSNDAPRDPLATKRDEVREALRAIVGRPNAHEKLKSSAFIALGRVGTVDDIEACLTTLHSRQHDDAVSAAALCLGLLPATKDRALNQRIHAAFEKGVKGGGNRSRRVREFSWVAMGLRARHDKMLAMTLARHCTERAWDAMDAAVRIYACGISRDAMLLPEVLRGVRRNKHGGQKLGDRGRSHAIAALGLIKSPLSFDLLLDILKSRRAGRESRRSAALALGRLLREAEWNADLVKAAEKRLLRTFDKNSDDVLRGYCAVALGCARTPLGIDLLKTTVDRGGMPSVKAYAVLALGVATPRLEKKQADTMRAFLATKLVKERDIDMASALSLAVGLAGADEAAADLRARVAKKSLPARVRGAAAEGLGLLGDPSPEAEKVLMAALKTGRQNLVEGVALGLGLLGKRGVAPLLVERLSETRVGVLQGAFTMALGYLGQSNAVDPLLGVLSDKRKRRVVKELSCVALGILGGTAKSDPLFTLDAFFNLFATTPLTHELLTIF